MSLSDRASAPSATGAAADHASALTAAIERGLAEGRLDVIEPERLQALMAAACRLYSAQVDAGGTHLPVTANITSTDIMATASGLLKAGNLAVFELGMWQSWTGR